MEFCWVPAGWFSMGSPDNDRLATPVEKPSHRVEIPYDYWLARYPVTHAHFRAYAEGSGNMPAGMGVSRGFDNHPVVQVSWHEARAFCTWLTETWRKRGALPKAWEVRLPSEAEWEKGARGGLKIPETPVVVSAKEFRAHKRGRSRTPDLIPNPSPRRLYPWGDDPDINRANYSDTNIAGTSPVGCFPSGASPYGCSDVSGNVWEWTLSLWGEDFRKPSFRYPYDAADGREDVEAADGCHRVLRAGAFIERHPNIRCAYRLGLFPNVRADYVGLRPVIAPCV
jgi:iron(II)-dependent oxidoreductase